MARVYQANSIYETVYFNTSKEAMRYRAGGDELPESIERLDAAEECNRLLKCIDDAEGDYNAARMILDELFDICSANVRCSSVGKRAADFIAAHPLPPATANDRDGGRSYGI